MRPRTDGLSFSSLTLLSLRRPSALTLRRCLAGQLFVLLTRRTLTVASPVLVLAIAQDLLDLLAALRGDLLRRADLLQALDRRAHEVDRVARADGLREHVLDADDLEHRAH